jgi:hypothetical protein
VKKIVIYTCEICGRGYHREDFALDCERYKLPPCPVKIGDKVDVYEEDADPEPDVIVGIKIGSYFLTEFADNVDDSENGFCTKEWWDQLQKHVWLVTVGDTHQIGVREVEESFTKEVSLGHIRVGGFWLCGDVKDGEYERSWTNWR